MKTTSIYGLLAFFVAIFLVSCGGAENNPSSSSTPETSQNASDGNSGGSDGASGQNGCSEIDQYIASANKYLEGVASGNTANAMQMMQEAVAISEKIEQKGIEAYDQACWERYSAAMMELSKKTEGAVEAGAKKAEEMMQKEADKMMKELDNM